MEYLFMIVAVFVTVVWYVRPLYNFFAKRKYILLEEKQSVSKKIQSGLPAIVFYLIIFALLFYPAITNELINSFETGTIIVVELIVIFVITRIDKYQTKYKVTKKGIQFRKKHIHFDETFKIKYKKTLFIVLHKPRFILKSNTSKITIPVLSRDIGLFCEELFRHDKERGRVALEMYQNIRNYYIGNNNLSKLL